MRKFFIYFFSLFLIDVAAQEKTDAPKETVTTSLSLSDEIFSFPDSDALPVGGFDEFYNYLLRNLQYPKEARTSGITGKVIVEFVIEKEGNISSQNFKVLKSPHESLSKEAIRLIKKGPKWIPGKIKGIPVRTKKMLPVTFSLA